MVKLSQFSRPPPMTKTMKSPDYRRRPFSDHASSQNRKYQFDSLSGDER